MPCAGGHLPAEEPQSPSFPRHPLQPSPWTRPLGFQKHLRRSGQPPPRTTSALTGRPTASLQPSPTPSAELPGQHGCPLPGSVPTSVRSLLTRSLTAASAPGSLPEGTCGSSHLCCWARAHRSTHTVAPPPLEAHWDSSEACNCPRDLGSTGTIQPHACGQAALPRVFRTWRQLLLGWELLGNSLSPWEPGSWVGGVQGARLRLLERGTPPASALKKGGRRGPLTALPDPQTIDAADQEAANVASFILEAHADRAWRAGHGRSCLGSTPLGWPGLLSVRPSIQRPGPPALTEGQPPRAADPQLHRGGRPARAPDEGGLTSELQLCFSRC